MWPWLDFVHWEVWLCLVMHGMLINSQKLKVTHLLFVFFLVILSPFHHFLSFILHGAHTVKPLVHCYMHSLSKFTFIIYPACSLDKSMSPFTVVRSVFLLCLLFMNIYFQMSLEHSVLKPRPQYSCKQTAYVGFLFSFLWQVSEWYQV